MIWAMHHVRRILYLLVMAGTAWAADTKPDGAPARLFGPDAKEVYGGGRAIRVADFPPSLLRTQLEGLSPDARARALEKLESLQFHRNDISALRSDREGGIYYVCDFGRPSGVDEQEAEEASAPIDEPRILFASIPVTSPPAYHSKPGSTNILFLDFNGHVVSNTYWNTAYTTPVWRARAFDTDGDETTFSDLEQRYIKQIWERVAEDYTPFDVDVTTEQPPSWYRRVGHALITPTTDADGRRCPHYGYGGIAYVNVFNLANYSYNVAGCYSPAWVTPMSGSSYASTAEAATHELGHNMGLSHDGTSTLGYYPGHAATTSAPSWGPIMGTAYGRNVSQWSKGEYYNANQTQDDLAIIAAKTVYKTDDHGSNSASATPMSVDGLSVTATGLIGRTSDRDVFSLSSGSGNVVLSAIPYRCTNGTWGGNSDLVLLLCDSDGSVLASNNIAAGVHASITQAVAVGTYYAHVYPCGTGYPTNNPPSGYTVYGSLGAYLVTGTVAALGDVVILSEPDGGEVFYRSNQMDIAWSSGFTNAVKIELYRGGALNTVIVSNTPNDDAYSWPIPGAQAIGTNYRIRVARVDNESIYDESAGDFSIRAPPVVVLSENFDSSASLPVAWTQEFVVSTTSWRLQNGGGSSGGAHPSSAYSGTNNAILYAASTSDHKTRLITPAMNLGGTANAQLTFQHTMEVWNGDQDQLRVFCRTNSTAAWVEIGAYIDSVAAWTERTHSLPNVSTQYFVAFEGNAKYGYGVCLDDVEVTAEVLDSPVVESNRLVVVSPYGTPAPSAGTNWYTNGAAVSASVGGSPATQGLTIQYVCSGWAGTGSVPASGAQTNLYFSLTNDSTLTWRWTTNFYFGRTAGTNGAVLGPTSGWYASGSSVSVTAAPADHYCFAGWSGDAQGDTNALVMTVTMDWSRHLTANFTEIMAACGTPEPWLAEYYPATNNYNEAELSDTDGDGLEAWKEYIAGTDPTDPASGLELVEPSLPIDGRMLMQWMAVSGRYYSIFYLTNLAASVMQPLIEDLRADGNGILSFTNT
ncbi:MAG: choice-of-anchor J domain-containing protein, partial [Verrucomicrobia bacterium]|nr:choice-of-anchor J domain-containing protein [Verrucomicrobiota bacterium]